MGTVGRVAAMTGLGAAMLGGGFLLGRATTPEWSGDRAGDRTIGAMVGLGAAGGGVAVLAGAGRFGSPPARAAMGVALLMSGIGFGIGAAV